MYGQSRIILRREAKRRPRVGVVDAGARASVSRDVEDRTDRSPVEVRQRPRAYRFLGALRSTLRRAFQRTAETDRGACAQDRPKGTPDPEVYISVLRPIASLSAVRPRCANDSNDVFQVGERVLHGGFLPRPARTVKVFLLESERRSRRRSPQA